MTTALNPASFAALLPGLQLPLGLLQPLAPDVSALLAENHALKQQVVILQQQLAAANARAAAAAAPAALGSVSGGPTEPAGVKSGKKKRKQAEECDEEYHNDENEEQEGSGEDSDCSPGPAKRRGSGGGAQDRAAAAATRAAAAADKQAQKEARQRAQQFLKSATSLMSNGMAWQRRGCAFTFSIAIDTAAFQYLFGGQGEEMAVAGARKRTIKLSAGAAQAVFGKGRCTKKYRLGSVGSITGINVSYDAALQKATCVCTWSIDSILGL